MVIATTFERRTSTRLSSWLKKVWDTDQRPGWMLPHVFDELRQYWNTDKFKAMSEQAKNDRGSLKDGSLHTGCAKTVGTITREMSGLQGIGSSRQAELLDGVQIVAMSAQIAQLTLALANSEQRRVAEQQSMSATVQQIKEQVLNLARRPTTSSLDEDIDDDSEEKDDFVDRTP
ncbi:hypothetical protein MTR67_013534 [Solanum verrucosum]|uniref:Transposase n=1 Tax=Solanum verrucosum TaxID=315347 RepID=A0AAF0QHS7_SOLVR|nr:hypothetical protein MTR67_013534 [Solanum verrucosum]